MHLAALGKLACPACGGGPLLHHPLQWFEDGELDEAIVHCEACRFWYPLEHGVLELLTAPLWYASDRERFHARHRPHFESLSLPTASSDDTVAPHSPCEPQALQQRHFDWYASNDSQSYSAYEQTPFWRAADDIAFSRWRRLIKPGSWLLDVGCAQGRSAFPFRDLDVDIIGIDISKELVRQAVARRRHERCTARYTFLVADASHLPLRRESMDVVVVYGVLHHLPQPGDTCREIHRILKPGGRYFGSENHASFLRGAFDLLMKIKPLWFEEAGAEPLLSRAKFERWLAGLPCTRAYAYSVFVPPHLVNWLESSLARRVLRSTDAIGNLLPGVRRAGGLILIEMEKQPPGMAG